MKTVTAGVFAILVLGVGWLSWNKYQSVQETEAAAQAAQTTAVQTERQLKAKGEDGITFAEYFKRATSSIDSLDEIEAGLQARAWQHKPTDRDVAVAFIEQCKAIIRSEQANTRLLMNVNSAQKINDSAKKELSQANTSVSIDWALKRYKQTSDELIAALQEQIASSKASAAKVEKLLAADDVVKKAFGKGNGLSAAVSETLRKAVAADKSDS
jgi:predicted RNase H-like nuclease (RuvC/YqgF family)